MTNYYREGMIFYKDSNYSEALELFLKATKDDPEDHRSYNASGICYSKIGDNEKAKLSFESALMLDSNNAIYQKNLEKVTGKLNSNVSSNSQKKPHYNNNTAYLIILFFIPVFCFIVNIWLGFFVLIISSYAIYRDAQKIHAGLNPNITGFISWSAENWGIFAFLLWIIVFYYIYKRKEIFYANIDYYPSQQHLEYTTPLLETMLKTLGCLVLICIIAIVVSLLVFGIPVSSSKDVSSKITVTSPTIVPVITHTITTPVIQKAPGILDTTWFRSRDLLIRDIKRSGQYEEDFQQAYKSGDTYYAESILSDWASTVQLQRASLLILLVPEDKKEYKQIANEMLKIDETLTDAAYLLVTDKMSYDDYLKIANTLKITRDNTIAIIQQS